MIAISRDPRISHDDELHVIGRLGVVVDSDWRFRAAFLVTEHGVLSSFALPPSMSDTESVCANCSRTGHRQVCDNAGVKPSRLQQQRMRRRRNRMVAL